MRKRVYKSLIKAEDILLKVLSFFSSICLVIAFFAVVFQVFSRYVLTKFMTISFPYTDEGSRLAIIIAVYLMIPVVFKLRAHPSIDLLFDKLSKTFKYILYYLIKGIMLFTIGIIIIYGIKFINLNILFHSAVCRIPSVWLYSWPLVGVSLLAVQTIIEMIGVALGIVAPEITHVEEDKV